MAPHLRLRVAQLNSRQKRYEIGTLRPELRLRDVPGNSVQRRRRSDRGIVAGVTRELALVQPPCGEVLRVARSPSRLSR